MQVSNPGGGGAAPAAQFYSALASWVAPIIWEPPPPFPSPTPDYGEVATWVGLDDTSTSLLQSGVDTQIYQVPSFAGTYWIQASSLWIESLPAVPWYAPISIIGGEQVFTWTLVADAFGDTIISPTNSLTPADDTFWTIFDVGGVSYAYTYPLPTNFGGHYVECIVERPCQMGNILTQLPNFGAFLWLLHQVGWALGSAGRWAGSSLRPEQQRKIMPMRLQAS